MSKFERIVIVTYVLLSFTLINPIKGECKVINKQLTCHCDGSQEFYLPAYNSKNVTSLSLSSCSKANLLYSSVTESNEIEEIVVKNISELLKLDIFLSTVKLKRFELTNIKRIPYIKHNIFLSLINIEHFEMRNVHVDYFQEEFIGIKVKNFVMANVTISSMEGFSLLERGDTLQISDCEFRNVSKLLLNFGNFSKVKIVNSKFELQEPGHMSFESDEAIVSNNIFVNVSMNLFAVNKVMIDSICADGRSSLRLSSDNITSFHNRLPNDIIYNKGQVSEKNNTICKASNCECPKSNGQNANRPITIVFFFETILLLIMCMIIRL